MSNFDVTGICKRGETVPSGVMTSCYGKVGIFQNFHALTDTSPYDQRNVWMMFVKNNSGGAILPSQLLAWKSSTSNVAGQYVTNPAATAGVLICGVADSLLPAAGAADGTGFLMTVLGPTKFLLDANATSAEFDALINSGSVAGCVRTGTTSGAIVGRNETNGTTSAGGGAIGTATAFWGFFQSASGCVGP